MAGGSGSAALTGDGAPGMMFAKLMGSAGISACVAETFTLPLDTVKVRLQIQTIDAPKPYKGLWDCTRRVAGEEGMSALWKGLAPGLSRQLVFASLRIGLYDPIRDFYAGGSGNEVTLSTRIAAGLTTGIIGISVANPVDLIKIRLQAEGRLAPGVPRRYNGMIDATRKIFIADGIKGFWTGVIPNMARNSIINAAELATYDQLKTAALRSQFKDTTSTHIVCALGAGFVATVVGSPVDVVKTRIMNSKPGPDGVRLYNSMLHCVFKTAKDDGLLAFYKGFNANFARIGSWNVVMFLTLEQVRKLMGL